MFSCDKVDARRLESRGGALTRERALQRVRYTRSSSGLPSLIFWTPPPDAAATMEEDVLSSVCSKWTNDCIGHRGVRLREIVPQSRASDLFGL